LIVAPETFRTGSEKTIRMAVFGATPVAPGPGLRPAIVGRFLSSVGRAVGRGVGRAVGRGVGFADGVADGRAVGTAVAAGVGVAASGPRDAGGDTTATEGRADAGSTAGRCDEPKSGAPDRTAMPTGTATPTVTPTTSISTTTSRPIPQSGMVMRRLLAGLAGLATGWTLGGSGASGLEEEPSADGRPAPGGTPRLSKSYWQDWQYRCDATRWAPHL
jgi:hypothetical protein